MPNGTSGGVGGAVERPPYPICFMLSFHNRKRGLPESPRLYGWHTYGDGSNPLVEISIARKAQQDAEPFLVMGIMPMPRIAAKSMMPKEILQ